MARQSEPPPNNPMPLEAELRLPPSDPQTEKFVLGTVLLNPDALESVTALDPSCFSTEALRRIHGRMVDMHEAGTPVDAITLADELRKFGQLESVGGFSMLVSLSEGLPRLPAIDAYLQILRNYAGRRRLIALGNKMAEDAYRGEQSPVEIMGGSAQTWQEIESDSGQADDGGRTPLEVIEQFPGGMTAFMDATMRHKGLPTGFTRLDEMMSGMQNGDIIVIGAGTGQGKTALALNIAQHLTLNPRLRRQVAFFSLEMSAASIITRMACSHGRIDQLKFRQGYLNKEERLKLQQAVFEITESNFRIYDQSGITVPQISKAVRNLVRGDGCHLVIVDYLQLVGSHSNRIESRNQEVSQMSRQFKMLASELDIPIILLSQLSRAGSKRNDQRPQLSDLRDSGSIEQDASVVLFIYREEVYRRDRDDLRGLADLIVAKQRNGPTGVVPLRFIGQFTKFENRAEDRDEAISE